MRHAHGEDFHANGGKFSASDLCEQSAHFSEIMPGLFGLVMVWRHGHEPANVELRKLGRGFEYFFQCGGVRGHTALRSLTGDVDFDEDRKFLAQLRGGRVQLLRQAK